MSLTYKTVTTLGDFGPWVSKLVLELPCEVRAAEVSPSAFNVFCARHDRGSEDVLMRREHGAAAAAPSQGFVKVLSATPCDEQGTPALRGRHVALEMGEVRVNKRIEGNVRGARYVENRYRVTQLAPLTGDGNWPVTGLVWDECAGDLCPALAGWHEAPAAEGSPLPYAWYDPRELPPAALSPLAKPPVEEPGARHALIVWLHGAGEGGLENGGDVTVAYTGNRVTALSQPHVQALFGGRAWVLVPQSPTFWMDDGEERLGRSNQSVYARPLMELVERFVARHADSIDPARVVIGGLSNGGFMTLRMCADHPGYFAAGVAVCAPFFRENQTPEVVSALAQTPLWLVHSKGDELVDIDDTALPLYHALRKAGAPVHFTCYDHVEDLTGVYRESDGRPRRFMNHGVWIHAYNDFPTTELDGTNVEVRGRPASLWEWAAAQRRDDDSRES